MDIAHLVALLAALALQVSPPIRPTAPQTFGDRAAAEATTRAYRDAWMSNDPDRVMATLTDDAVIYPSTLAPIAGAAAIRQFWFPTSGPASRVVGMELTIDSVHVDGDTAITSGSGSLTFVVTTNNVPAPPRTQKSWHVNILRRQSDLTWRIWRRMWGDVRG
jgi:ketosteroid isomerase-like protein